MRPASVARAWMLALLMGSACAQEPVASPADGLRAQYLAMESALGQSGFPVPMLIRSHELPSRYEGEAFAVIGFPLAVVRSGLNDPAHWCDILNLHANTKYCRAELTPASAALTLNVGKATPQDLVMTQRMTLNFAVQSDAPDFLNIALSAAQGPTGTSDHRIVLEATELPGARTFLHLRYGYSLNFIGRLALHTYLQTAGRNKVGFTVLSRTPQGQPVYLGGALGMMERNTMRYYLAIDAYLATADLPAASREDARLMHWIDSAEQYALQLHDLDRAPYLAMKRAEIQRQRALP